MLCLKKWYVYSLILGSSSYHLHIISALQEYIVVYDIPNTTLEVDKFEMEKEVAGFAAGTAYAISKLKLNPRAAIENDFRNLLNSFGRQQGSAENITRDPDGEPLPTILTEWLMGNTSSAQIVQRVNMYAEYNIFKAIAKSVFNNDLIAKNTHVLPGAEELAAFSARLVGADHLYLVGNWDKGSFELIATAPHIQGFLQHIPTSHRFISGFTRFLLPRQTQLVFQLIAERAHVPFNRIIFISGMPYHIAAARQLGIHVFSFTKDTRAIMQAIAQLVGAQS